MTRFAFPYPPRQASGLWTVTLPAPSEGNLTSIGEVLLYATALELPPGWLAYRAAVLASGPMFYWTFEDSLDRLADQTANGRDGTLVTGTPDYLDVGGPGAGPYLDFTSTGDRITLGSESWMDGEGLSIEYFIRYPDTADAKQIIARDDGATARWWTNWAGSDEKMRAYTNNATGPVFSSTAALDDDWHHFVWTWNINSGDRTGAIYIDGALDSTQSAIGIGISGACDIYLGSFPGVNSHPDVDIAHIAMYDYRLDATEVADHFAAMGL